MAPPLLPCTLFCSNNPQNTPTSPSALHSHHAGPPCFSAGLLQQASECISPPLQFIPQTFSRANVIMSQNTSSTSLKIFSGCQSLSEWNPNCLGRQNSFATQPLTKPRPHLYFPPTHHSSALSILCYEEFLELHKLSSIPKASHLFQRHWFIQQILNEHALCSRHCPRCWIHSSENRYNFYSCLIGDK